MAGLNRDAGSVIQPIIDGGVSDPGIRAVRSEDTIAVRHIRVGSSAHDSDVRRVQQPVTGQSLLRRCRYGAKCLQVTTGRGFHLPTVSTLLTAFRANLPPEVREALGPQHSSTAIPGVRRRHINESAVLHHHLIRITDASILTLPATTDVHFTPALAAGRRDAAPLIQQKVLTLHHNLTAFTGRVVCLQAAAQVHHATVAAVQHNVTVPTVHAAGFHHTAHVQHRVHQHIPAVCRQEHLTVTGADQTAVLHQGVHHIPGYLYRCQATIVQLQRYALGRRQYSLTVRGADGAAVADPVGCQHNIASGICGQGALVDNRCPGFLSAAEGVTTVHEVVVFYVTGGGHET